MLICGKSSMPFSILTRQDVRGRCYRRTFHRTPPCITTIAVGSAGAGERKSTAHCANSCALVVGKNALPTAAAIDSQSVKTTEKKGRSMAMMAARRSKDVNDFSLSIASDWC